MKFLQKPLTNYLGLVIAIIISTLLIISSKNSESAGMAMLILPWIPLTIGFIALLGYLLLRYLSPKWGWIVTLLGIVFMLVSALQYYFVIT